MHDQDETARYTAERRSTHWLLAAALLFIVTRGLLLTKLEPALTDVRVYFHYAVLGVDRGQTAFKDFAIEYPPAAWWWIRWPRVGAGRPLSASAGLEEQAREYARYHASFRWHTALLDAAAVLVFWQIVRLRRPEWAGVLCAGYVASTALLGNLLHDRLDTGLALLLLLWAYAWIRSLPRSRTGLQPVVSIACADEHGLPRAANPRTDLGWRNVALALLGAAISFKLIPIIVLPFLLLAERNERGWLAMLRAAAIVSGVAVAPFALHYGSAGWGTLGFLTYHGERGLQIESLYASLLMAASHFGWPIAAQYSHGAWNVVGPLVPAMQSAASVSLVGVLAALGLWACAKSLRFAPSFTLRVPDSALAYDGVAAYRCGCLALVAAVVLSKVFSPQYLLWALPLALLLAADVSPARSRRGLWLVMVTIAIAALSTWLFPYHYFSHQPATLEGRLIDARGLVPALSPRACTVLVVRNGLYLGLTVWLGAAVLRSNRRATSSMGQPLRSRVLDPAGRSLAGAGAVDIPQLDARALGQGQ